EAEGVPVLLHPPEVGAKASLDLGPRPARLGTDLLDRLAEPLPDLFEQGEVELSLRLEMLVQDRLGDARRPGDVVHRRAVEAMAGEDLQRHTEELLATGGSGKARRHGYLMVIGRLGRSGSSAVRARVRGPLVRRP